MTFVINNTDYNPTFDESYFEVNSIINTNTNDNNSNNANKDKSNTTTNENNTTNNNSTCDPTKDNNCKEQNKNSTNSNTATPQSNDIQKYIVKKITSTMNGEEEKTTKKEEIKPTATLEDVIYPLYLPTGTVLKEQEKVNKTDGERVILTFAGDKGFTLVEETAIKEKEFTIIPTYGEPGFVNDTIGAITDNSLNWISNGVEYYMVSDVMNTVELLDIANSINVASVASLK